MVITMKKEYQLYVDTDTATISDAQGNEYDLNELRKLQLSLKETLLKDGLLQSLVNSQEPNDIICPYCGSKHVHKYGKNRQGNQRYQCACKRTFILKYNTLTYHSHLNLKQWETILFSTLNNDYLSQTASLAEISIPTAFYCRHKILYVLVQLMNEDILLDEAELDETYLTFQNKGYIAKGKRGISEDKIGIACAIDKYHHTVLAVADRGRPTSKTLIEIFDKNITHGMVIISDSQRSYHPLMKHLGVDWKKIPSRKKEINGYDLKRVNTLHDEIKTFFRGKRNVMTHYLLGYLALFQYRKKYNQFALESVLDESFFRLNCIKTALRNRDICPELNLYRTFYQL